MNNTKSQFEIILEAAKKTLAKDIPQFGKGAGKKESNKKYSKPEALEYFRAGFDETPVLLWIDKDDENGPRWLNDVTGEVLPAKETSKPSGVKTYKIENVSESYDRKRMTELSDEYSKLTKEMNSILAKYGVKPGALLTIAQEKAIQEKMSPADKKNFDLVDKKISSNRSELAKISKSPARTSEKYPLGGRDEKSGRSYSS